MENQPLGLVRTALAQPSTPLAVALDDHSAQVDKLADLVNQLATRLNPVCSRSPQAEGTTSAQDYPPSSLVVSTITSVTERIKHIQSTITTVLSELEV